MDLVNLMYCYINRFINSSELLKELKSIDLSKYPEDERKIIQQLILDIGHVQETIPNEIDEVETERHSTINDILDIMGKIKENKQNDADTQKFLDKQYTQLLKEKKEIKDGGKLYANIFDLLTKNTLVNQYAEAMNDKELLEFITQYISVPIPPPITQEVFDALVNIGIEEDKREALWRLAFNYNQKNMDFSHIVDYFVEKRDDYYLAELIYAVEEDLDIDRLIDKIISTKDKEFIHNAINRGKKMATLFTDEQIKKMKNAGAMLSEEI